MNKKLYFGFGLFFSALSSILFFSVSSFQNKDLISNFTRVYNTEVEREIERLGSAVRNDLLENHILVAQNKLQKMTKGTRVRSFRILPETSSLFSDLKSEETNEDRVFNYSVLFSKKGEKWGDIVFYVSMTEIEKLKNSLMNQRFFSSLLLLTIFLFVMVLLYLWGLRVSSSIDFHIKESMGSSFQFRPNSVIEHVWKPLFERIYRTSNEVKSLRNEVQDLKAQEKFFKLMRRVSHDIRSPVGALKAILSQSQSLSDKENSVLAGVCARIENIADFVLSSAKSELINLVEAAELRDLIEAVVQEKRLVHQRVKLIEEWKENLPQKIFCNKVGMQNILSNIVNNAIEASAQNDVVIVKLTANVDYFYIEVVDKGMGVGPEKVIQILEGAYTSKNEGNSLGVSSSKNLVEAWGGAFDFNSKLGLGTKVTIKLPYSKP